MYRNVWSSAPSLGRPAKRRPRFPAGPRRLSAFAALALLTGLVLLPGCHDAPPDDSGLPAPRLVRDDVLPANLPAPSPLFALVSTPPPAARQVGDVPLPPEPPDVDSTAQQSLQPPPAPARAAGTPAPSAAAPSRYGLLVCDPVAPSSLADFGVGCGHWLHLMAAGQPTLGRTPLWEARARIKAELGRTDMRLTQADLAPLPNMLGVTHAACGAISGTTAHCTLTYQLYSLPDRRPVGPPVAQAGTLAQVAAALPGMARAIDVRLGLTTPVLPAATALTPDDMARLGAMTHGSGPSDADLLALSRMNARSPLPGMFLLETRASRDQIVLNRTVKEMMTEQPQNALVVSQIGYVSTNALRPYAAQTALLFRRYPQSALLAHTEVWEQRLWGSRRGERAAALRVPTDSPRDPDSWLTPGQTIANIAQDLRQCRVTGDLSPTEERYLVGLYGQWEGDTMEATLLDPKYGHAWSELTQAATFEGDNARAVDAFWKAQKIDANKAEVYSWGLEMFQTKWGGDPAALDKVAGLAAAQEYDDADSATDVAGQLRGVGAVTKDPKYAAMADRVMARIVAADRAAALKRPGDAFAHWDLAGALNTAGDPVSLREATLEYRIAEHLLPNAPQIHYWLANTLDKRHKGREAIAELRQAVALDPFYTKAHFDLGFALKRERRFPEALTELRLAMRLDPRDASAHYGLGDLLEMQHQHARAAAEYSEAVRMTPYLLEAWGGLCGTLDETGRYDDSLRAAQRAIHFDSLGGTPDNPEFEASVRDTMADDYLHKKAWDASLAQTRTAISLNAGDPVAQENIAEAYWGQGKRAEARAQWVHVVSLGDPNTSPVARKMLATHP